ncbi:PREDICTED: olfactory receptor 10A7-like, partial [Cariama cristata]|uniref:olfactory receptor 10A7-like n=1 Tax=Cariama cristata TaxID=54380 RepID=UPI0005204441
TAWVFTLPFCGLKKINYFFCDIPRLIMLSCTDTSSYEKQTITATALVIFAPFCHILVSYACIISSSLKISSAEGRQKTFSTCFSHLTVVTLYYASGTLIYLHPKSSNSQDTKKVLALVYTTIIPILNPLIYSLRNKEVKGVLIKIIAELRKGEHKGQFTFFSASLITLGPVPGHPGARPAAAAAEPLGAVACGLQSPTIIGTLSIG